MKSLLLNENGGVWVFVSSIIFGFDSVWSGSVWVLFGWLAGCLLDVVGFVLALLIERIPRQ